MAPAVRQLLAWFGRHARDLPWRRTRDPYAIWVAEVMLQQTRVATVVPYWQRWMRALPTVRALARARPEQVLKLWEGLGYYSRARNLHRAAREIVRRHGGRIPHDGNGLRALPGVGRYTAGAIASIAFNQPAPVVDGNVIRVLTRAWGMRAPVSAAATRARLWALAETLVQAAARTRSARAADAARARGLWLAGNCAALNQGLMELGAVVCTPRNPRCEQCPWAGWCVARRKHQVGLIPVLRRRRRLVDRQALVLVATGRGHVWLRQRPAGSVNAGLWEFPVWEPRDGDVAALPSARPPGLRADQLTRLATLRHTITHHRITLHVMRVEGGRLPRSVRRGCQRVPWSALERLAFSAAHRKIALQLQRDGS